MNRQTFTRNGNAPDLIALANVVRPVLGDPFYVNAQITGGALFVVVDKPSSWLQTEITFVQNAVNTAADQTDRTDAQAFVDQMPLWAQAMALVLVDQINLLRSQPTTTFATVTPAQALAAIRTKAGTL